MFRFLTAGESHGPCLTIIVEGLPAGLPIEKSLIDADLRRRQGGYGRGERMRPDPIEAQPEPVTRIRPGHADFTGAIKYGQDDIHNVIERSSSRETASRVAVG